MFLVFQTVDGTWDFIWCHFGWESKRAEQTLNSSPDWSERIVTGGFPKLCVFFLVICFAVSCFWQSLPAAESSIVPTFVSRWRSLNQLIAPTSICSRNPSTKSELSRVAPCSLNTASTTAKLLTLSATANSSQKKRGRVDRTWWRDGASWKRSWTLEGTTLIQWRGREAPGEKKQTKKNLTWQVHLVPWPQHTNFLKHLQK